MLQLTPIVEVVTDGPVRHGSVAHLRAGYHWTTTRVEYGREEVKQHFAPVPACAVPTDNAPPATDGRGYSGGWARHRGAVPCTAEQCFPGDA
ncbi:hypothetical protein QEZ54_35405 [Catellatospora sp. KI3]|uniref:hypothetical protein n=1 Tax=Catellatospora sp. KI3 TaxID=3041620 RepID=UPI002482C108|nr:hypothetical protein [Catellatospora sp. KI3]MDI1466278.1 hypothetical protein [Catellatospora sp. KI3]